MTTFIVRWMAGENCVKALPRNDSLAIPSTNPPTRQPVFSINDGPFNPEHKHHLQIVDLAKGRLEEEGYDVVRGVLTITSQDRLWQKNIVAMSDACRLEAIARERGVCDAARLPALLRQRR